MSLQDVPTGTRNLLDDLRLQFERLAGGRIVVNDDLLEAMAKEGNPITTLTQFGRWMAGTGHLDQNFMNGTPWLQYGMDADEYHSQATTFATEYKKITGQDIPPDQLSNAFNKLQDKTGGLLTGSEYAQYLTSDQNVQKAFGWVKFGMDYHQWQQQQLSYRQQFGREIQDSEAATILQYTHAAQGGNHEVAARVEGGGQEPKQQAGISGSVVR